MGRSGRISVSANAKTKPTYTLKVGTVKKISQSNLEVVSLCGQQLSLTKKCVGGNIKAGDLVTVTFDSPGYLSGTKIAKINKPIFGTVKSIGGNEVLILTDSLNDHRRVLTLPSIIYEDCHVLKNVKAVPFRRIKLFANKNGNLTIDNVKGES